MVDIYSEKLDPVIVCGVHGLFANGRVDRSSLPKGLFKYDIRHDDDGNFCTLETFVLVNHAGTVITREPIPISRIDYIEFDEDSAPNFTGCPQMTVMEFMERSKVLFNLTGGAGKNVCVPVILYGMYDIVEIVENIHLCMNRKKGFESAIKRAFENLMYDYEIRYSDFPSVQHTTIVSV